MASLQPPPSVGDTNFIFIKIYIKISELNFRKLQAFPLLLIYHFDYSGVNKATITTVFSAGNGST